MDSGSLIMLVIVGLIILAILIGSVAAISCTILYGGDRLRPGTTGHFWMPENGATYGMPDNGTSCKHSTVFVALFFMVLFLADPLRALSTENTFIVLFEIDSKFPNNLLFHLC